MLSKSAAHIQCRRCLHERMQWRDPVPGPELRRKVLAGLNDARTARNRPLLVDPLEDE